MSPSPEVGLLAWAAGAAEGPAPLAGVRWDRLIAAAEWHGTGPLLWDGLRRAGQDGEVPGAEAADLREHLREVTARNLHLLHELDRVLAVLASAGIEAVLLKGAALLSVAYRHPGLRPMADLDLLVRPADLAGALAAVEGLGYRQRGGELVGRDVAGRMVEHHHHFPLVGPGLASVELHHRSLELGAAAGDDGLWAGAVPVPGHPGRRVPCPEDLFATIAGHFVVDRRDGRRDALRQVADLRHAGELVEDWDRVVDQARRWAIGPHVHLAAETARRVAGLEVPAAVDALRSPSTTDAVLDRFVATRVLVDGRSLTSGDLGSRGLARLFPGRAALEVHIRPDDARTPSVARLQARRARHLVRRAVRELPRSRGVRTDLEVARWLADLLDEEP